MDAHSNRLESGEIIADSREEDTVVDCDLLLAAKENIQPLSKGRSATALSAVFSTPLVRRDMHLTKQKEAHRGQVKAALDNGDPLKLLDAYEQCINWTIESYPQGDSAESGIVELIEEATRLLKERRSPTLDQNESYLRMWLLYADYVERPMVVYAFLLSNEIGTEQSAFYESYADELERAKRFKEADDIYSLGINRKAHPLARLETRYRNFKSRMMSTTVTLGNTTSETSHPSHIRPQTQRKPVLGSSSNLSNSSGLGLPSTSSVGARPKPKSNSCLVFTDETATTEETPDGSPWADLGTRQSRRKENTQSVTKAGDGIPLFGQKSRRIVSAPPRGGFVPFEDDLSPDGLPGSSSPFGTCSTPSPTNGLPEERHSASKLRTKTPHQLTESEALRKDPLKNYNISS